MQGVERQDMHIHCTSNPVSGLRADLRVYSTTHPSLSVHGHDHCIPARLVLLCVSPRFVSLLSAKHLHPPDDSFLLTRQLGRAPSTASVFSEIAASFWIDIVNGRSVPLVRCGGRSRGRAIASNPKI